MCTVVHVCNAAVQGALPTKGFVRWYCTVADHKCTSAVLHSVCFAGMTRHVAFFSFVIFVPLCYISFFTFVRTWAPLFCAFK